MNKLKANGYFYKNVTIEVPGSTANLGLYFDRAGAALTKPHLRVILEPIRGGEIELVENSSVVTPIGRRRGFAGKRALSHYLNQIGEVRGFRLTYEDVEKGGFPTGGTGLSGAESVGAILAAAVLLHKFLTETEVVWASAKGEPGEHKDNVAPSVMGGIVFLSDILGSHEQIFNKVSPPTNLGLAIGFSTHSKIGGTEATRNVLSADIEKNIFINQVGRATIGALSLQQGKISDFIKVVSGDQFHELRRADAGMYGNFSYKNFLALKKNLYENFGIGLAVSGAGPNMQLWYDKNVYLNGIEKVARELIKSWFEEQGIGILIRDIGIAKEGAYAYAQKRYPNSALAKNNS